MSITWTVNGAVDPAVATLLWQLGNYRSPGAKLATTFWRLNCPSGLLADQAGLATEPSCRAHPRAAHRNGASVRLYRCRCARFSSQSLSQAALHADQYPACLAPHAFDDSSTNHPTPSTQRHGREENSCQRDPAVINSEWIAHRPLSPLSSASRPVLILPLVGMHRTSRRNRAACALHHMGPHQYVRQFGINYETFGLHSKSREPLCLSF
jgi:hypothetical protein